MAGSGWEGTASSAGRTPQASPDKVTTSTETEKDTQKTVSRLSGLWKPRRLVVALRRAGPALAYVLPAVVALVLVASAWELWTRVADIKPYLVPRPSVVLNRLFGDLGFFAKGAMVKPFSDAAFALKPGEFTRKPVKTQFGWHVIKLVERRTGSVPSFEDVREKLSGEMTQRVMAETVGSLRKDAAIETFGLDGGAPAPTRIRRVQ